jgi:hypothetical protein
VLAFGVAFHIVIGVAVNLPFFSALMILTYCFFLDDPTIARLTAAVRLRPLRPRVS